MTAEEWIREIIFKDHLLPFQDIFELDIEQLMTSPKNEFPDSKKLLFNVLISIRIFYERNDWANIYIELNTFWRLFSEMYCLKEKKFPAFKKFKRKLIDCQKNEYYGIRLSWHRQRH